MITVRPADARGRAEHGWLHSRHTFSFADYYDPKHMGFRALRVINEDIVEPGMGFGRHPHRDMEIISYVLEGALRHDDSLGTGSTIYPGEVQRMSAGTGVVHSEFNASAGERVHFLQIWIEPARRGLAPSYEQKAFADDERRGRLHLVAGPESAEQSGGALTLHADARLYASLLAPGTSISHALAPGRHAWVQMTRGKISLNGTALAAGDGAAISDDPEVRIEASDHSELLLFDLA